MRDEASDRTEFGNARTGKPGYDVAHSVLGYDTVWFTRHALSRMKQRLVNEREVLRVLDAPTRKGLPTQAGRLRWRRSRSSTVAVDVVFEKWEDKLCVVTVMVVTLDRR